MAEKIEDLWPPDFGTIDLSPVTILREQAENLTRRTEGSIRGQVRTLAVDGGFTHVFQVVVPSLDGYSYELFTVHHAIPFYPLTIDTSLASGTASVATDRNSSNDFARSFGAESTLRVIHALLSQVQPLSA